jgi:hypothetical protein
MPAIPKWLETVVKVEKVLRGDELRWNLDQSLARELRPVDPSPAIVTILCH